MASEENYLPSLKTANAFEGRQLAIKLSRKSIGEIQRDPEIRKNLRDNYAIDSAQLIASAHVIAVEFQTIAMANDYWK